MEQDLYSVKLNKDDWYTITSILHSFNSANEKGKNEIIGKINNQITDSITRHEFLEQCADECKKNVIDYIGRKYRITKKKTTVIVDEYGFDNIVREYDYQGLHDGIESWGNEIYEWWVNNGQDTEN